MAKVPGHRGVGADRDPALVECDRCGRRARPEHMADAGYGEAWRCRPRAAEACAERAARKAQG